jgi:hypothetical protein
MVGWPAGAVAPTAVSLADCRDVETQALRRQSPDGGVVARRSAFGGKPENICSLQDLPISTQKRRSLSIVGRVADQLEFGERRSTAAAEQAMPLRETLQKILTEYSAAKGLPLEGHTLYRRTGPVGRCGAARAGQLWTPPRSPIGGVRFILRQGRYAPSRFLLPSRARGCICVAAPLCHKRARSNNARIGRCD